MSHQPHCKDCHKLIGIEASRHGLCPACERKSRGLPTAVDNPYCEKHEFPAGMGFRCPDCVEVETLRFALERVMDKELLTYTRQGIIDGCPDVEVRVVQMAAWHYAKIAEAALAGKPPFDCGNCGGCKLMNQTSSEGK